MAGVYIHCVPFTGLWSWYGSNQGCGKQEQELETPKVVVSVLVLVVVMMLLCAGDIETNPGPRNELHPGLKNVHSLLEKAIKLMGHIFGGDDKQSYLSTAVAQANELTESLMDLDTNFRELGLEEDQKQLQAEFLAHIAQNFEVFHLFYKLPKDLFHSEGTLELPPLWLDCYQHILSIVVDWTDKSTSICEQLASSGLLYANVNFIKKFGHYQIDEIEILIEAVADNMLVIHNCAQRTSLPSFYYYKVDWADVLNPWMNSESVAVRLHSQLVLAAVSRGLHSDQLLKFELLKTDHVTTILEMICAATQSPDLIVSECDYDFSAAELVVALAGLVFCSSINQQAVVEGINPPVLLALFACKDFEVQRAVCHLLWVLDSRVPGKIFLKDAESSVIEVLKQLQCSEDEEVQKLSKCAKFYLQPLDSYTDEELIEIASACYQFGDYAKCLELSGHVSTSGLSLVSILRAKALFHLYSAEQELLKKKRNFMPPKEYYARHHKCYSMAKNVIVTLGETLDSGKLTQSSEASQMLDLAMRDFIFETNRLHETSRCYLCRVKQLKFAPASEKTKFSSENPDHSSTAQDKNADNPSSRLSLDHTKNVPVHKSSTKSKAGEEDLSSIVSTGSLKETRKYDRTGGLRASHLFPKFMIQHFTIATSGARGARVCLWDMCGSGQERRKYQLLAPKLCSQYMLCDKCEGILSRHGEAQFARSFFEKIYNEKNPNKPKEAQSLSYGSWLYLFCLGLVFRMIHIQRGDCLNTTEVHKLLCKCRECLLNAESLEDITSKPDIYLFISPVDDCLEGGGHEDVFLADRFASYFGLHGLNTCYEEIFLGDPGQAQFYLVHIGVINIVAVIGPSCDVTAYERFCVSTERGVYTVPANEDRKTLLPQGLLTAFQILSLENKQNLMESPLVSDPQESAAEIFEFLKSQTHDESTVPECVYPSVGSGPFEVAMLPSNFKIDFENQSNPLVVPDGHHILLHHSHGGPSYWSTVFLGVGRGGAYSLNKPYVIWCSCEPTSAFYTGFFISPEDLAPVAFLPDRWRKTSLKYPEKLLGNYAVTAATLLHCALEEKGCHSLKSIIDRLPALDEHLPMMDSPCSPCCAVEETSRCWYCAEHCNHCMKTVPALCIKLNGPEDDSFKFCSQKCFNLATEFPTQSSEIYLVRADRKLTAITENVLGRSISCFVPCCAPISLKDEKLLHIYVKGKNWAGYCKTNELALCIGWFPEKKLYVVCHERSLSRQILTEFFVSPDLLPGSALPYISTGKGIRESLEAIVEDGTVQCSLQRAIAFVMSSDKHCQHHTKLSEMVCSGEIFIANNAN